ncbi:hypothetical protein AC578_10138 [Lecanosticta acicola]|uniref:BTB domain-containing protein n=1 Tax=Lecanosticta acicola TaxID=111012 RepID=A0AAI8Z3M1_9PEZI|nr:hypothetical protein AC578_10138 [Lecanosticta acicola]
MARAKNKDPVLMHAVLPHTGAIDFSAKSVIVKVGTSVATFHVDEGLLRKNSAFFDAALKKDWAEGQRRKVELPKADPETFNIWVNWLYSRRLFTDIDADTPKRDDHDTYPRLIEAYTLGDSLMDADFKDAVTDAFSVHFITPEDNTRWMPHSEDIKDLYERTASTSKLRKLLIFLVSSLNNVHEVISGEEIPSYLADLAKFLFENRNSLPDWKSSSHAVARCEFHEHEEGEEKCYRTKYHAPFTFTLSGGRRAFCHHAGRKPMRLRPRMRARKWTSRERNAPRAGSCLFRHATTQVCL